VDCLPEVPTACLSNWWDAKVVVDLKITAIFIVTFSGEIVVMQHGFTCY